MAAIGVTHAACAPTPRVGRKSFHTQGMSWFARWSRITTFLPVLLMPLPASAGFPVMETQVFGLDGVQRDYLVYTPGNAASFSGKRPLVLVIHGGGGTHRGTLRLTKRRFNRLADAHGFYVVYPNAIDRMWDFGEGKVSSEFSMRRDDLNYFRQLIAQVQERYPIDPDRVFASGMSRGGQASWFLACRLPGTIRAIAPFTMPLPAFLEDDCRDGPPVPVALFNGTADPIVPYDGGEVRIRGRDRGRVLSTDETLALWRKRNGCPQGEPHSVQIDKTDDGTAVERLEWPGCRGAPVVLYRIIDAGHTWPSGRQYLPERLVGKVSQEIDGADEAWRFFSRF